MRSTACAAVERSHEVVGEQVVVDGGRPGVGVAEQVELRAAFVAAGGRRVERDRVLALGGRTIHVQSRK